MDGAYFCSTPSLDLGFYICILFPVFSKFMDFLRFPQALDSRMHHRVPEFREEDELDLVKTKKRVSGGQARTNKAVMDLWDPRHTEWRKTLELYAGADA